MPISLNNTCAKNLFCILNDSLKLADRMNFSCVFKHDYRELKLQKCLKSLIENLSFSWLGNDPVPFATKTKPSEVGLESVSHISQYLELRLSKAFKFWELSHEHPHCPEQQQEEWNWQSSHCFLVLIHALGLWPAVYLQPSPCLSSDPPGYNFNKLYVGTGDSEWSWASTGLQGEEVD